MTKITTIEGIGPVLAEKFAAAGVKTTEKLLDKGRTPKGRADLAQATGASEKQILEWTNRADLFRVKGIGEEYSDLLEAAGVDTVVELAGRNPENLHAKLGEVNAGKKKVRREPTQKEVEKWVAAAKLLPRMIEY